MCVHVIGHHILNLLKRMNCIISSCFTANICLDCPVVSLVLVFQELEKKGDVKSDEEGEAEGGKKEDDEEGEEEEIEGECDEEVEEVKAFTDSRISG